MIVASTQKLDASTTFFGGGSSNCCSSLLIESSVKIGWNFGAENVVANKVIKTLS